GHVLQLAHGQLSRVDDHAALGAAVRDVDHGALPRHPHGQRLDLVQRHVGVVADAALGRPAVDVVLDAVPGEHLDPAVVHLDREVAGELALPLAQDLPQLGLQADDLRGLVELALRRAPFAGLVAEIQGGRQLFAAHIRTEERGYSAAGSQITLTQAGTPER